MQNLKEIAENSELSAFDKELIRAYVQEAPDKEEKQKRRRECAEQFGASMATIAAITAWTTIREKRSSANVKAVTEEVPPKVEKIMNHRKMQVQNSSTVPFEKIKDSITETQKFDILNEMRDIMDDPEEMMEINNHIVCIADHCGVSPWTIELAIRQNIKGAIELIDGARQVSPKNMILDASQKEEIRIYVSEGKTNKEKQIRREEMSIRHNVGLRVISAITAWDTIRKNRSDKATPDSAGSFELNEAEVAPPASLNLKPDLLQIAQIPQVIEGILTEDDGESILPTIEEIYAENNGAHIDYDFESKNKWRDRLKAFMEKNTTPEERKTMKVLCLPGKKCLEIQIYLELGFLPENIVGVEGGDDDAIEEFKKNAELLGISYRIGRLEKILEHEKLSFDIVSLDFLGPPSSITEKIFYNLKTGKKSIIMTNFQGRRENQFGKKMRNSMYVEQRGGHLQMATRPVHDPDLDINLDNIDHTQAKNTILYSNEIMIMALKRKNDPLKNYFEELLDKETLKKMRANLPGFNEHRMEFCIDTVKVTMLSLLRRDLEGIVSKKLCGLFIVAIDRIFSHFSANQALKGFESFKYRGYNGTPMMTDMFVFEQLPESYYFEMRHLVDFLFKLINLHVDYMAGNPIYPKISIEFAKGHRKTTFNGISYKKKDKIKLTYKGKDISEITLGKLSNILNIQNSILYRHKGDGSREELLLE